MQDKRNQAFIQLTLLLTVGLLLGCGVRGDPVPPQRPAELGRGRPTYRRATERVKVQTNLEAEETEETEENDEENEENE
ncbi:MAG: hypothetical protein AB7N80_06490 [Bdellovibrionales bacterium]